VIQCIRRIGPRVDDHPIDPDNRCLVCSRFGESDLKGRVHLPNASQAATRYADLSRPAILQQRFHLWRYSETVGFVEAAEMAQHPSLFRLIPNRRSGWHAESYCKGVRGGAICRVFCR
jgi:hypothetical protein